MTSFRKVRLCEYEHQLCLLQRNHVELRPRSGKDALYEKPW